MSSIKISFPEVFVIYAIQRGRFDAFLFEKGQGFVGNRCAFEIDESFS